MNIIWHGQSCFQIISNQGKQGQVNIVIDPYSEDIGLRIPKLEADILLSTHQHHDHNNIKAVGGNPFLIQGPGEYEVKGVFVQGIPAFHDQASGQERGNNTIYTIEAEDLKLCHLGDLGQKELTPEQIETIGGVDILMIPVGGVFTISAKEAVKIMSQIEPSITIPMHYQLPRLKIKGEEGKSSSSPSPRKRDSEIDGLDKFFKVMGIKKLESLPKLSIKKKDISSEEAKIIVLNP